MPSSDEAYTSKLSNDSLHLLLKDFSSLNRAVELRAVLRQSIHIIQNMMDAEAGSLMLLDEGTGELEVTLPSGPVSDEIQGKRIPKGRGFGGWVIDHEEPYFSNDAQNNEIFAGDLSDYFTTKSIICVPLSNKKGIVFGVLQAINRKGDEGFSEKDIPVFEALADHVAIAIERTRESENLQKRLQEKELMLTEVHHRVKNNLSTLTALIEMEFAKVESETAEQVLRKTCSRIESMTEIHDLLYHSGLEKDINLGSYLKRLAEKISSVLSNPSQDIAVNVEAEPVLLDTERAMSCGLLLNELLVNAYKHAFQNRNRKGKILVKVTEQNENVELEVVDNGEGLSENFSFGNADSVGSWLIDVLLRRLNASIEISREQGAGFMVHFEK